MVGTPIENMRGRQPVAVELLLEIGSSTLVEVGHGALQPGGNQFAVQVSSITSPNLELSVYNQGTGSIAEGLLPTGPVYRFSIGRTARARAQFRRKGWIFFLDGMELFKKRLSLHAV